MYTYKHESKPCAAIRRFFRLQRWLEFSAFMIVVIAIVVVIVVVVEQCFYFVTNKFTNNEIQCNNLTFNWILSTNSSPQLLQSPAYCCCCCSCCCVWLYNLRLARKTRSSSAAKPLTLSLRFNIWHTCLVVTYLYIWVYMYTYIYIHDGFLCLSAWRHCYCLFKKKIKNKK